MDNLKFAKIIELPDGHQCLLLRQEQDEDDGRYRIDAIIQFENFRVTQSLVFDIETQQFEAFEKMDAEGYANNVYQSTLQMFS